ncbi:MAG: D-alanyl-D-alanine carboxypeptidase [Ruminococcaceae bacterium]|nr:D-alanyl-D-alanine carboxypeptidase [Oscillospiraceae bacterium]
MIKNNHKKYRIISALLAVIAAVQLLAVNYVFADGEEGNLPSLPTVENAHAVYLYNFENDQVLFEQNSTERVYPTSTVKIMTAIVAFEEFKGRLDTRIAVTEEMLDEVAGNQIGFKVGEIVTVEQMLYCMLVNSANDAAIILAHGTAGSTAEFVKMMNEKAGWIGAYNTYYTNPTGMHDNGMITTARDTATIAKYAYSIPGFIEITSTPKYVMEATNMSDYRNIYNRNCLISKFYNVDYYYSKAVGMNAGTTTQGGYALCGIAEDAERSLTYLAVILEAEKIDGVMYNYENAINLFEWAFKSYDYTNVLSSKKMICELPVNLSSTLDYVTLVPSEDITVYLPTTVNVSKDIRYSYNTFEDSLDAPVEAGQEVGTITVLLGDDILGSCPLITTSSITRSEFLYFLDAVRSFSEGRFFRGTVISVVVLSILYVLINAGRREKKFRRSMGRK